MLRMIAVFMEEDCSRGQNLRFSLETTIEKNGQQVPLICWTSNADRGRGLSLRHVKL
jgi:hypothetical protein